MWGVTLWVLAFAVSLDSLSVGVAYGLRDIRIPLISVIMIAFCSGLVMFVSMNVGAMLTAFLPVEVSKGIGAVILIGIGVWALFSSRGAESAGDGHNDGRQPSDGRDVEPNPVLSMEIKPLGLVIQILKKPSAADVDRSGIITIGEAVLLGAALSLDALGAGLGAALIGLSPWVSAIAVSLMSGLFLLCGIRLGHRGRHSPWLRQFSYLPGFILIFTGLSRFWW